MTTTSPEISLHDVGHSTCGGSTSRRTSSSASSPHQYQILRDLKDWVCIVIFSVVSCHLKYSTRWHLSRSSTCPATISQAMAGTLSWSLFLRFSSELHQIVRDLCELKLNGVGGKIPEIIGNFTARSSSRSLHGWKHNYWHNSHTIQNLPWLCEVSLSNNMLEGPIPSEIFQLQFLRTLNLSNNKINGEIPKSIGEAKQLIFIDLSSDDIRGAIPETISNLTLLQRLVLSNNWISGEIPKSIGLLSQSLNSIELSYNCLQGVIPESLSNLTFLYQLTLNDNQLSGTIYLSTWWWP